ncbi:hypothetical protein MRB53_022043 [Persea americana]|uniref:Uncharacterized protein n=1 Tax=Persea americana TaxID=3435 RepID=A0ACC2L5V2_PERAE|nr:hypothetical protein MRB53_022043 [Persea americana]
MQGGYPSLSHAYDSIGWVGFEFDHSNQATVIIFFYNYLPLVMAQTKFFSACVLLLLVLMIVSNEILVCEGRHLKSKEEGCSKCQINDDTTFGGTRKSDNDTSSVHHYHTSTIGNDVDDFRPTAPGHSPGIGHSR